MRSPVYALAKELAGELRRYPIERNGATHDETVHRCTAISLLTSVLQPP